MSGKIILNEKDYYEKVYGGWLGKNIGGTLGEPMEGRMEVLDLSFYPRLFDGPLPNDDLDLQLVWLHAVEQYGARLTAEDLGKAWLEHVFFPYDEYGYALTNLRRGLQPPVAGWFGNPFTHCMGSPIRSEIWGMLAPGTPDIAARYAWQDAIVDHAGGEGVYGEMFFAAIESAAFIISDVNQLLDIGMSVIPADSRVAQAVNDLRKWHREGKDWLESRSLVLEHHGRPNFTDAPQNIAFTILGWLYGEDFGDAILKAVNCGYDTDCTGATLGAILGIIHGRDYFPEKWIQPVGDRIAVSPPIKGFPYPRDLDELARRTMTAAREVLAAWSSPVILSSSEESRLPDDYAAENFMTAYELESLWNYKPWVDTRSVPPGSRRSLSVAIDYGPDGPAIGQSQSKEIQIRVANHTEERWEGRLTLSLPEGWSGPSGLDYEIGCGETLAYPVKVVSAERIDASYDIVLNIERFHDDSPWMSYPVRFSLVSACHLSVYAPGSSEAVNLDSPSNRVAFERVLDDMPMGRYKLRTALQNPRERYVRLIADTKGAVKATLNGKLLFEDRNETTLIPAYHRSAVSKQAEILLPAGKSIFEVEVEKCSDELELYLLVVATKECKTPGMNYYFNDILFVRED